MIVNKDFPQPYIDFPRLYIASVFFDEREARLDLKERKSKGLMVVSVKITPLNVNKKKKR